MYQKARSLLFPGRRKVLCSSGVRQIPLRLGHGPRLVDPRSGRPYISNAIRTSRYTVWDFLPKQIFYQFSRLANFYFLCMAILQLIPGLSTTGNFTVLIPLLIFVSLTIFKEGYDDFKRYRLDKAENRRSATVLRPVGPPPSQADHRKSSSATELDSFHHEPTGKDFEWTSVTWQQLSVGDVIKLSRDDDVPADIVLLHAEGDAAYIETMALDGETDLKRKQAPGILKGCHTEAGIATCNATITVEEPNQNLYRFDGQAIVDGEAAPLSDLEVIYRGSTLRNTSFVTGVIINTGEETKIRMNANRHPKAKRPALETFVNKVVIFLAILVVSISGLGYLGYALWQGGNGGKAWYMYSEKVPFQEIFFGFLIMFNSVVPMSLIMGMELIKLNQMNSINRDLQLYHAPSDTPVGCNTDTIIDDLGQIGYVFSDKTGTLTENDMKLRKLSIVGKSLAHRPSVNERSDFDADAERPKSTSDLTTDELLEYMRLRPDSPFAEKAREYLLCLAICHTAQPEIREEGLEFQASSPDELALVKAAQELGFFAVERSAKSITVQTPDSCGPVHQTYDILDVLEFNSDRKRMSIIVGFPDGRILLVCKGADTVLLPRMTVPSSPRPASSHALQEDLPAKYHGLEDAGILDEATIHRRCFQSLDDYAQEGLRTLVFCQRFMSQQEYQEWKMRFHDAQVSLVNRQERIEALSDEIEQSLELVGASAIEDRLQDGVPETVDRLRRAGIKIWMLTGDKRETAINIAHSAKICSSSSTIYDLDIRNGPLETQCREILEALQSRLESSTHTTLIVDGTTLHVIQEDNPLKELFYSIIPIVDSVVCCRASPSQKALLVAAIKHHKPQGGSWFSWLTRERQPLTLAIGDGANDLAMITTAHVGIGISGKEGQQAARIADFSLAQFRFLGRLLLVHGRWNYHRTTRFILAVFWKELFHAVPQALFQAFAGFTGTSLFESMALIFFGSLFTGASIVAIGSWEQDLNADTLMAVPQLYSYGQKARGLNVRNFLGWVSNAILAGLFVVCVCWAGYGSPESMDDNGLYAFGALIYTMSVIWANVKLLLLELHNKTIVVLGMFAATIAALWMWIGISAVIGTAAPTPFAVRNGFNITFGRDPVWWMTLIVGLVLLGSMELILKSLRRHRLTRAFWMGIQPAKEKADLTGGGVRTGFEAWYPHLWQEIEQDPDSKRRLRRLIPEPIMNLAEPGVVETKGKSKRPSDTRWRQQRLKAWRPILTSKRVVQLFFAIKIAIFPIAVVLLLASRQVEEVIIDYTDCGKSSPSSLNSTFPPRADTFVEIPGRRVSKHFKSSNPDATAPTWAHSFKQVAFDPTSPHNTTVCSIQFDIENRLPPPVFVYYRLSNFHQNHRDYIESTDISQLGGKALSSSALAGGACGPLDVDPATGKPYYPCGLIANSMFNDTFSPPRRIDTAANETYNMTTNGIAFPTDRGFFKTTKYAPDEVVPPPNWCVRYPNGYTDGIPNLSEDESFMVWMRTAALASFRKMAMRNDRDTMSIGRYQIDIEDNYEVSSFGGTKSIILTRHSKLGGRDDNLASLCFLIGSISLILGVILTVTNLVRSRKLAGHTLLASDG